MTASLEREREKASERVQEPEKEVDDGNKGLIRLMRRGEEGENTGVAERMAMTDLAMWYRGNLTSRTMSFVLLAADLLIKR